MGVSSCSGQPWWSARGRRSTLDEQPGRFAADEDRHGQRQSAGGRARRQCCRRDGRDCDCDGDGDGDGDDVRRPAAGGGRRRWRLTDTRSTAGRTLFTLPLHATTVRPQKHHHGAPASSGPDAATPRTPVRFERRQVLRGTNLPPEISSNVALALGGEPPWRRPRQSAALVRVSRPESSALPRHTPRAFRVSRQSPAACRRNHHVMVANCLHGAPP
ncbi:hypothetical protein K505DRAFT_113167 [Melanomma pulvis-pyrius CBS 109.77]|uniref:Uncharacterized protein n=1 Tax=Melanomma pulvis-pyrius CBS 109.77 TaxID=1314802 RepID=A0A6A6WVV4_9PLEO|nr:hypothetical protein K505DRAFT_113167 [Melanomma pulvis-pyrius CBS 109.77]